MESDIAPSPPAASRQPLSEGSEWSFELLDRYDREIVVDNPDGSGSTNTDFQERPHHTVVVESVDGNGAVTVLEQNAPPGSPVRRTQLFFADSTTTSGRRRTTVRVQGTLWFYRPQAR